MTQFAQKSLGQNFLNSPEIRDKIIFSAGNISDAILLEIGPGLGFLTTKLLKQNPKKLWAVEIDPRSVEILKKDFGHKENFELIQGDILKQDIDKLFGKLPYSVIANIPYNITSPIIRKFLADTQNKPEMLLLMVQKEVAEKICTTKKRSLLSISVEIFATAEFLFEVPRYFFSPIPKVDSAIIRLKTRPQSLVSREEEKDFFTVLHAGFSQKRKKIGNYIGSFFGFPGQELLGSIDPNKRAETLSLEEWKEITYNFRRLKSSHNS